MTSSTYALLRSCSNCNVSIYAHKQLKTNLTSLTLLYMALDFSLYASQPHNTILVKVYRMVFKACSVNIVLVLPVEYSSGLTITNHHGYIHMNM